MSFKKISLFLFVTIFANSLFSISANIKKSIKVLAISREDVISKRHWNKVVAKVGRELTHIPARDVPEAIAITAKTLKKHFNGIEISLKDLVEQHPLVAKHKDAVYEIATTAVYNESVIALLRMLKEQGVILVFASNTGADWAEYLRQSKPEVFGLFDIFCLGTQEDGKKPDQRYFERMCSMIMDYTASPNLDDVEILFVDPNPKYIQAAATLDLGIETVQFISASQLENTLLDFGYLQ